MGVMNILGLPFWKEKIDPKLYDKEKMTSLMEKNYKKDSQRGSTWGVNSRLHHSYFSREESGFDDFVLDEKLDEIYLNHIQNFIQHLPLRKDVENTALKISYDIVNYTIIMKDQWMEPHFHPESDFAAVHYLKFNHLKHSQLYFTNENKYIKYLPYLRPHLYEILDKSVLLSLSDYFHLGVREDDFIIFPSWCEHQVFATREEVQEDDWRMAIVMNIKVQKHEQ